jgi:hypothetical protein
MSLYDAYSTDKQSVEDGIWVEVQPGVRFKVRSEQSVKVREWAARRAKGQRQLIVAGGGILPPHLQDKNEVDQCAQATVVDWEGVSDRQGNPVPFSKEACTELVTELPALRRDLLYLARTDETFRPEEVTAALGKTSGTPSAPTSNSADKPSA